MRLLRLLLALTALLCTGTLTFAQFLAGPPKAEPSLLADSTAVEAGRPFTVGIRFKLDGGWHLYWRFPGDSGAAPQVEWQLPPGFEAGPIQWPLPHLLRAEGDLFTNVYEEELLLPVEIRPPSALPTAPFVLKAKLKWYVCKETCLPGAEEVSLEMNAGKPAAANEELFALWRGRLPEAGPAPFEAAWKKTPEGWQVTVRGDGINEKTELFPIPPTGLASEHSELLGAKAGEITFKVAAPEASLSAKGWRGLVVLNGVDGTRRGWEVQETGGAPGSAVQSPPADQGLPEGGLAGVLWAAFLGGLLLNLMPCVLPVIALKILGFTQQAGQEPKRVFRLGLSFCAGVFAFFLGLAGAVVGLKAAGSGLNWGFQFQNPWILMGLISAVFVFGLNLIGVFEISLSGGTNAALSSLAGKQGHGGAFMHGAFTTLLGTSCTAPYLGVTLGFAMSQPAPVVVAIFLTIAAGMSLPYLVLTSNPTLLRFLPKPGLWMERLKQLMGFIMLAVAAWLLGVLGTARGLDAISGACAFLLVLGFCCWLLGILGNRTIALLLSLLLAAGGFLLFLYTPLRTHSANVQVANAEGWKPFSPERLLAERAAGRPVFVDFTADWCVNCKVNERVALARPEVLAAFEKRGVVKLKADWTSDDATVTAELKKFGRASVPFYLLYPPGGAEPLVLPSLLTPGIVLNALEALPPK
jgi:thiol:disulfide interchange protein DsbD